MVRFPEQEESKNGRHGASARHSLSPEIARWSPGTSPAARWNATFYSAPEVFDADLARILHRHWLFAGYAFQVAQAGRLLHLPGGHRIDHRRARPRRRDPRLPQRLPPSRLADLQTETGNAHRLVCPYHRWTYELDGALVLDTRASSASTRTACRCSRWRSRTPPACCSSRWPTQPPDFSDALATIRRKMKPHAIERAKIAHQVDYVVKANWKIVFENNRECYHCPPNHKEYNTAAYDVQRDQAMLDPSLQPGDGRHRGARQCPLPRARPRRGRRHVDHDRRVVALPSHAGGGRLRDAEHGRQAAVLPDGRHQGVGLRHLAHHRVPQLLAAHQLRLRRRRAADADRSRTRPTCAATGWSTRRRSRARTIRSIACCRSGTSPTGRTGRSARTSRPASARTPTRPAPSRWCANATWRISSTGISASCSA